MTSELNDGPWGTLQPVVDQLARDHPGWYIVELRSEPLSNSQAVKIAATLVKGPDEMIVWLDSADIPRTIHLHPGRPTALRQGSRRRE